MKKSRVFGAKFVFGFVALVLAFSGAAQAVDEVGLANSAISEAFDPPTICAGDNKFLVAWVDYRAGATTPIVVGCIVSGSGLPGVPFIVSSSGEMPATFSNQRIQAAWNGTSWLLVWDDHGTVPGVRGAILDGTGAMLGGTDFLIAGAIGTVSKNPLATYTGSDFMVAWEDNPSSSSSGRQIYYCAVSGTATLGSIRPVLTALSTLKQHLGFLCPQYSGGDTLMAFTEDDDSPAQSKFLRIAQDGSVRNPGGTTIFLEDITNGGYGSVIGVAGTLDGWRVLSSYDQRDSSAVYQHTISPSGVVTAPAGVFTVIGLGPSGSPAEAYAPVFAGSDSWLFLRPEKVSNSVYHIIGKRVTYAGVDKDPIPFQVDFSARGVLRAPVAAQAGGYFLATWLDGRDGASQPADGTGIYASLLDNSASSGTDTPLVATITATPTSGEKPLTVNFSSALSTGSYDSLKWDFGDSYGATDTSYSHTYRTTGTFLATLTLIKGAYQVYAAVPIKVGTGGGTSVQVGAPVEGSQGMVTQLFLSAVSINLNFAQTGQDSVAVTGVLDTGTLPESLTGVQCSIGIGTMTKTFGLDASGSYKSDSTKNSVVRFVLTQKTGVFGFSIVNDDLRSTLYALGVENQDVKTSDKVTVTLPVTVAVGNLTATATCGVQWHAVRDNFGTGSYVFQKKGAEISGSFLVGKFAAKETNIAGKVAVHAFTISGQLIRPDGAAFKAASNGEFVFTIGNYITRVPSGQFPSKNGKINFKFKSKDIVAGLSAFTMNSKGLFTLKLIKVPAASTDGSGMPVANSGDNIVDVDLNLSVQMDMADGQRLSAGRYIFTERKNASAKAWTLRTSSN